MIKIICKLHSMIRVYSEKTKDKYDIIAVADHQKDLNNLRLMSYRLNEGKDRVQLNKDKYGGPYLKFKCDQFLKGDGSYDVQALDAYVKELQKSFQ